LIFIYNTEGTKGTKWIFLLEKEASVNGVVLTPLTPFNSLNPHLSYESAVLS